LSLCISLWLVVWPSENDRFFLCGIPLWLLLLSVKGVLCFIDEVLGYASTVTIMDRCNGEYAWSFNSHAALLGILNRLSSAGKNPSSSACTLVGRWDLFLERKV
jgi:hypothetical protein